MEIKDVVKKNLYYKKETNLRNKQRKYKVFQKYPRYT